MPGTRLGAVKEGSRLYLSLEANQETRIRLDYARHRRILNLDKNYARLNEFPEWYVADENLLYRLREAGAGQEKVLLGSELIVGVTLKPGLWILEPLGAPLTPR